MLTIMSWLWKQPNGRATYTAETVNIWADMVGRNLTIPHQIACVTDHPEGVDPHIRIISPPRDFENVEMPGWGADKPQCLRRLAMFRPDAADVFGERFVSMDLDCVVYDSLDPLFDVDVDFKMYRGTNRKRPYNGSLLMMRAGARPQVYRHLTPLALRNAASQYVGSDQAWISSVLGAGESTWGPEDGVHAYRSRWNTTPPRLMFFLGNPKPWDVEPQSDGTIRRLYRKRTA
jgi:hypothetical protein